MDFVLQQGGAALLGAILGTAICGTADHFARDQSVWPLPICGACGVRLRWPAWIPLLGPLAVQRRCAECGARGHWRTGMALQVVCGVLGLLLLRQYGFGSHFAAALVEALVLVAVTVTDFRHRLIPMLLVYPCIVFALATSPLWPNLGLLYSALGALAAFVLFFLLAQLARLMFGDGALGDGDISLAVLIGAICGFPMVVVALALGAFAGGIGAMCVLLARRSALGSTIPYGPYLALGMLYILLIGNTSHSMYTLL